ncbi:MAG: metallophosphoesterase [Bacillota bacterium]|nr:metallophosphoesterase [Bacillota bacterium]
MRGGSGEQSPPAREAAVRILALADVHGSQAAAERILAAAQDEGDLGVILLAGDLTRFFTPYQLPRVLDVFLPTGIPVLAVAGNCDGPAVHRELERTGCSIAGRGRTVAGIGFCGVPSAPPHRGHTWEVEEAELAAWLEQGYAEMGDHPVKILVTHSPPDGIPEGVPGSTAVAEALNRLDFDLVVCGHIHEARGVTCVPGGRTLVLNCGCAADGHYALVELDEQGILVHVRQVPQHFRKE